MADWFFHEIKSSKPGELISLSKDESRHLKVKRNKLNSEVILFDAKGLVANGTLVDLKKDAIIKIINIKEIKEDSKITIAFPVPKGNRMDWILEKLTELNVNKIIPIVTKHSQINPREHKQERWQRIVVESCKQCKRANAMNISDVKQLEELNFKDYNYKILLDQNGSNFNELKNKIKNENILIILGPEGGLSETEKDFLINKGFIKVKISNNTLRIETAALAAAAIFSN